MSFMKKAVVSFLFLLAFVTSFLGMSVLTHIHSTQPTTVLSITAPSDCPHQQHHTCCCEDCSLCTHAFSFLPTPSIQERFEASVSIFKRPPKVKSFSLSFIYKIKKPPRSFL